MKRIGWVLTRRFLVTSENWYECIWTAAPTKKDVIKKIKENTGAETYRFVQRNKLGQLIPVYVNEKDVDATVPNKED